MPPKYVPASIVWESEGLRFNDRRVPQVGPIGVHGESIWPWRGSIIGRMLNAATSNKAFIAGARVCRMGGINLVSRRSAVSAHGAKEHQLLEVCYISLLVDGVIHVPEEQNNQDREHKSEGERKAHD